MVHRIYTMLKLRKACTDSAHRLLLQRLLFEKIIGVCKVLKLFSNLNFDWKSASQPNQQASLLIYFSFHFILNLLVKPYSGQLGIKLIPACLVFTLNQSNPPAIGLKWKRKESFALIHLWVILISIYNTVIFDMMIKSILCLHSLI